MKRLTAIFLAAIILLSSFEPVVAAEKTTTENIKIKWLLENNFIVGRGQEKDLNLEDTITRAEFTRMILASKGEENLAKEDSTSKAYFKDVPESHWAEKFIAYAKEKGYISGYPDGNFRPEGKITYEEMISILSRIHPNYRKIETSSTNWAEGFINFAKDNGILDDINIKGSYKSPAIREKTFEMIYNFIKFVENQTKFEKVSKAKEEKEVKKENSTWNGFYPYWLGYGFRPSAEEKPDVKPNPDVKPAPDKQEKPEKPEKENPGAETPKPGTKPEAPKEFDKTKIDKVEILNQPSKLVYTEGEKLDLSGIKLKLTDTQGIVKEVGLGDFGEHGITTDPANETELSANENGTTIKIKLNGVEKVETEALTVNAKVFDPAHVEKMVVKTQPTKLNYTEGEKLNLTGLEVTLTDKQGLTKDVAFKDFGTYGITTDPANDTELKLADNGKKVKLTKGNLTAETNALTVKAKVFDSEHVESIEVKTQPELVYTEGEQLDLSKLVVTLKDKQGLTEDIPFANFQANGITAAPANDTALTVADNTKKVTLTKGNLTVETNALTVLEKVVGPKDPTKPDGKNPDENKYWTVKFESADTSKGAVAAENTFYILKTAGKTLADLEDSTPAVTAIGNNKFDGWDPALDTNTAIDQDRTIKAQFSAKVFDPAHVEKMVVKEQPTKLVYTEGEKLNLAGLEITLTDNQGLTKDVAFKDFGTYGITATPANDTVLEVADNNGKAVKLTKGSLTAETEALTVKAKELVKIGIDPDSQVPNGYTRIIFDAGEDNTIDGTNRHKVIDVLTGTEWNNAKFTEEIPSSAKSTDTTKEFEKWSEALPKTGEVETKTFTAEYKSKAKFIEVTDIGSQIPEGYERLTFDATADGKIGSAQVKAFDVLKGTTYDDAKLIAKIKEEVVAVPTDKAKEFKGWKPEIPTGTEAVVTKKYEAEYKEKVFDKNNITKIEVIAPPTKLTYVVGEKLNLDGLKVRLTDNQGVTKGIGLAEFDDYKIKTEPEKDKSLTESDNNTKIIIKRENTKIISENISLILKVISQADFEKENKIKTSIKNSLVEVYKSLGDLKLGIDNLQNKYYLLFTKDASEIKFDKENLKASILNTIKTNKITSYTIGESTRDLTKTDDEILGFIREDILKISGLEGIQNVTDAQILEQLKTTKPNTKIKLVFEDGNVNREFDYEIIFLTQMAEEKLNELENKFANVMNKTVEAVPKLKGDNFKIEVSYADKSYMIKFSKNLNGKGLAFTKNYGYERALTNFLTGEELEKSKSLSSLKSIAINSKKSASSIDNWGLMERLELEDLLTRKYLSYIDKTKSYHETFGGSEFNLTGLVHQLFDFKTSVEYFYADEGNGTGVVIIRNVGFDNIK